MSSAATRHNRTMIHRLGELVIGNVAEFGDLTLFAWQTLRWMVFRLPKRKVLVPILYEVGVRSVPVILITGTFIGMVLSVQSYDQFNLMHLETHMGAVITISLVEELGPVLAAVMLAGRVGSAMAAELGTMRVTEQIDALRALGANPIQYLVVPRFVACVLLIPLLTTLADAVGILGGWFFTSFVLGVDSFHYWYHTDNFVMAYDVLSGIFKSIFFGGAIALIACHRGFNCGAGAEGVGRAATEAFVYSFVSIMILDFFVGIFTLNFYYFLRIIAPGILH